MSYFETVKLFDLANAPSDIRDADDLAALRPNPVEHESAILTLQVGQFDSTKEGSIYDNITREITLTEYRLHRWLTEQGAEKGETVLVRWKGNTMPGATTSANNHLPATC